MTLPIRKKACIPTARLTLQPYAAEDLPALVALLTNADIAKTFLLPVFESPAQAETLAAKLLAYSQPADTDHLEYGIYLAGKLIGFVNDCGIQGAEIEIGYVIHPAQQGHGYATEAVRALLVELREMGFRKVRAGYFAENVKSLRVMEKCGMHPLALVEEITYRGEPHLCYFCETTF